MDHKKLYIKTTLILAVLTIVEVMISYIDMPRLNQIGLLLGFAVSKIVLVAYVYMHLYYESHTLRKLLFIPIPLVVFFLVALAYDAQFNWIIQ